MLCHIDIAPQIVNQPKRLNNNNWYRFLTTHDRRTDTKSLVRDVLDLFFNLLNWTHTPIMYIPYTWLITVWSCHCCGVVTTIKRPTNTYYVQCLCLKAYLDLTCIICIMYAVPYALEYWKRGVCVLRSLMIFCS